MELETKNQFEDRLLSYLIEEEGFDGEMLAGDAEIIFNWMWNEFEQIREDAWKYRDLNK